MAEFWEGDAVATTPAASGGNFWEGDKPTQAAVEPLSMADPLMAGPRIKRAFDEGVGDEPYGMSQDSFEFFQKHGIFREDNKIDGVKSVLQAFAENVLYPVAGVADAAMRIPGGLYRGAQQAAIEWGAPKDVASIPDAFMGSPHPMGVPRVGEVPRTVPEVPAALSPIEQVFQKPPIVEARELGVIGTEKPAPTFDQSPSEMAQQALPRDLSSASTPEDAVGNPLGHKPGEYDARGKEWIDKIEAPDDVREVIENIAKDNDYFPEARGGVASPEARAAVAEAAGIAPGELDAEHFATHFDSDGKVRAVIQAVRQTAKDVVDASEAAVKNPSVETAAALAEAQMRHTHVLEYTMGLRAESGRSLAAWKDLLRETERTKARVALKTGEQPSPDGKAGEVPRGTSDLVDAANDVQENIKNPEKKLGLQKLIDAAQELVGKEDEASAGRAAPLSPEIAGLVSEARKTLKRFGAEKDTELEGFRQSLERLADGDGKISDTVEAARELLKKNEKPATDKPKSPNERGRLMGAAKRLVEAQDKTPGGIKPQVSAKMQAMMETARQAVGRIKTAGLERELSEFREALAEKDAERAAAAANRLLEAEAKPKAANAPKPPVEHEVVMDAARRVAKAVADSVTKEKPEFPPDIASVLDEAKNAVGELKEANKSELGKLIDAAEKQAVDMVKQKVVKKPLEALPPDLQALVDKTQRVVSRFGGVAHGEKAALLLARTGRTVAEQEQLARSVVGLTPNQVAKVLERLRTSPEASQRGWFYWLWQQGLISGLVTHTKYLAVNTATVFAERVLSPLIAAGIGKLRGQDVSLRAPLQANMAIIHSLPDAFASAGEAFRTGNRIPLASEMRLFERGEESPQAKGASNAYNQSPSPDWGIWKRVFNEDQLESAARVLGIPGRSANMIHTFYKVLSERAAASTRAYEEAYAEGARGDKLKERHQYHLDNPSDDALRGAVNDAYSGAFMAKLSPKLGEWAQALSGNPITKWLFPFQHIPWNIQRMTFEYSPLAVLGPEMRGAIMGKKGAPAQNLAIAKMAVGSSVIGYFIHKALVGDATGDYPTDPNLRKDWKSLGIQPNSIKIGGVWASLERLGPAGNVAHLGAEIGSIIKHWDGKGDFDEEFTKALWSASVGAANLIGNEVGFQTLRNLFDAMKDEKAGAKFVAWQAGTFVVPYSSFFAQNASIIDPHLREAKDLLSGFKYKIPLLRETLPAKLDPLYGEPIANPGYHSVLRTTPVNTDPVKLELQRLEVHPTEPQDRISGVKLTPEVFERYETVAGQLVKSTLAGLVASDAYQKMPDNMRAMAIHHVISTSREMVSTGILAANQKLMGQAVQQRLDYINGASKTLRPKKAPELVQ